MQTHLERREGWGMSTESLAHVLRPGSVQDVVDAFAHARANGMTVSFWGNGRSYGDAALNESNLLLDFSSMNQILSLDAETGLCVLQPGVQLVKLWRYSLPRGFWPPVVSGTMFTTIGGCASANVHGKNNWKYGPWGDHIVQIKLVTPDGELRVLSRDENSDLFHYVIGGFGMLGAIVEITVKMKRVHSGRVKVIPFTCANLDAMFDGFERCIAADNDYIVGWIDAFGTGSGLGRGQIHAANYLKQGEDPEGERMMQPEDQELPSRFFLVIPKGWLHIFARPMAFRWGMKLINWGRFFWMDRDGGQHVHMQTHAQFNHLLDFVPNWKKFYKPGGLIQYQLFVPKDRARDVMRRALEMAQQVKLEPWLVVMKRHRADDFPMSHAVDGYSFALDFPVTDANREPLYRLCERYNELIVDAGGRFYFAKDSVITPQYALAAWGKDVIGELFALKDRVDPDTLLQGNLWRRVFGPLRQKVPAALRPKPEPTPEPEPEPEPEPAEVEEPEEAVEVDVDDVEDVEDVAEEPDAPAAQGSQ